jgi:hypothetical protein
VLLADILAKEEVMDLVDLFFPMLAVQTLEMLNGITILEKIAVL